jgi:heavy metal translocating P-type ATPase
LKKFLKKQFKTVKRYWLFSMVLAAIIVGFILYLSSYHAIAYWIIAVASIITTLPLAMDMLSTLRDGRYGIDVLAITAIVSSVVLGQYWTAAIIAFMLTGGEALEDYAENRAKSELKNLLDNKPKIAHLIKGDETVDIKVSLIKIGDKLSILPGEIVPVDCEITEGDSSFDEASITGESLPVDKAAGEQVLSGSINIEGSLVVKALRSVEDSQYEQIIKLVRSASSTESPFVRLADRYSVPFTVIAYVIAGSAWYISGHAIRFLEVIVVATPCPLLLAAPIALISGMSRAAKYGIIVKNGSALEKMAESRTIAFDKTGTLTNGVIKIEAVKTFGTSSTETVLSLAASIEKNSNHILGKAIVSYADLKNIKYKAAKQVKELAGHGLSGRVQGKQIYIGRLNLMEDNDISMPKGFKSEDIKTTASYVAVDGHLAAIISFGDEVRPEAKGMLKRLKNVGIKHILMVTGDNKITAQMIAKKLGISEVKADCLPADKMRAIEEIKERPVVFVGDGVNDAPVLTLADVGIALGAQGSTAASESADVVIMLDDVSKVASVIEVAKRTFFIAKQSIIVGIVISIGLMAVFSTGHFKPIYGAVLQEVVDVVVIFNALRAHSAWQDRKSKKVVL